MTNSKLRITFWTTTTIKLPLSFHEIYDTRISMVREEYWFLQTMCCEWNGGERVNHGCYGNDTQVQITLLTNNNNQHL